MRRLPPPPAPCVAERQASPPTRRELRRPCWPAHLRSNRCQVCRLGTDAPSTSSPLPCPLGQCLPLPSRRECQPRYVAASQGRNRSACLSRSRFRAAAAEQNLEWECRISVTRQHRAHPALKECAPQCPLKWDNARRLRRGYGECE